MPTTITHPGNEHINFAEVEFNFSADDVLGWRNEAAHFYQLVSAMKHNQLENGKTWLVVELDTEGMQKLEDLLLQTAEHRKAFAAKNPAFDYQFEGRGCDYHAGQLNFVFTK